MGTIREHTSGERPLAYVAAGLFAYRSDGSAPDGRTIETVLGPRGGLLELLEARLVERMGAREVLNAIGERHASTGTTALLARASLLCRSVLAAAAAIPLPDPPQLDGPAFGESHWLPGEGRPSNEFRQDFIFHDAPLGALVALGRLEQGAWTTRHRLLDLAGLANPPKRAVAMLLGRTKATPRTIGKHAAKGSYARRGLISDAPIPAENDAATYRVALADLFGRFGPPAEFEVSAPERPAPPAPAPQLKLVLDGPDGAGGPQASPGHVNVSIAVPSVADLANGSLDIASIEIAFDGVVVPIPALAPIAGGSSFTVTAHVSLPKLPVGGTGRGTLTARFVDTAGTKSEVVEHVVAYADRRRPFVVPTGLGLIWTSRPGPSPDVELKLVWRGASGTRYRVYVADEKGLAVDGSSRAQKAMAGGQRDRAGTLGGRNCFRLLTEPPLEAVDGTVTLSERLPRSLGTVQFLRIVPVTEQGRESEFDKCGVVPVAVPSDRRPPPPRVEVSVDPGTGIATLRITAMGLDLVELEASEPGLFTDPPSAEANFPEFRLRRASGLVYDPVYAREIARGPLALTRDGASVVFTSTLDDPSVLSPFIRYSYWAEVRMPAERRLARGIVEVPPSGAVQGASPAQIVDMPRLFSAASAPASTMHLPVLPVPGIEGASVAVIADAGTFRASLTAASTPTSLPKAVGPHFLRIWQQWGGGSIASVGPDLELDGSPLAWEGPPVPDDPAHTRPLTLRFVVIDPVGRQSELTTITAP